MNAWVGFSFDDCYSQIQFVRLQEPFQFPLVTFAKGNSQIRKIRAQLPKEVRHVIAEYNGGGANPDVAGSAALQFTSHLVELREERLDELEQPCSLGGKRKRPPVKKHYAKRFL